MRFRLQSLVLGPGHGVLGVGLEEASLNDNPASHWAANGSFPGRLSAWKISCLGTTETSRYSIILVRLVGNPG